MVPFKDDYGILKLLGFTDFDRTSQELENKLSDPSFSKKKSLFDRLKSLRAWIQNKCKFYKVSRCNKDTPSNPRPTNTKK